MAVDLSDVAGRMLATSGVWEPHVTAAFGSCLSRGDVCVDVGAHVGYYTLVASKRVGPNGHVYALEPAPDNFASLCANLELNGVTNVTPIRAAAGAAEGRAFLRDPLPGNSGSAAIVLDDASATEVTVRTVSEVVSQSDLGRVRVVKIDVEGYEVEVLRGLASMFEHGARPALFVELHGARAEAGARELAGISRAYGLRTYELQKGVGDARFSTNKQPPRPLASPLAASFGDGQGCNLLLAP